VKRTTLLGQARTYKHYKIYLAHQ